MGADLPLTMPKEGDDVRQLWKHVVAAGKVIEEQRRDIFVLKSYIQRRKKQDDLLQVFKYDATKPCAAGTLYKVRADDDAVVTGVEISEGVFVKATPGKYLALSYVPANPTSAEQIPQLPDLISTDPEAAGKCWEFITPDTTCIDGDPIEI